MYMKAILNIDICWYYPISSWPGQYPYYAGVRKTNYWKSEK